MGKGEFLEERDLRRRKRHPSKQSASLPERLSVFGIGEDFTGRGVNVMDLLRLR